MAKEPKRVCKECGRGITELLDKGDDSRSLCFLCKTEEEKAKAASGEELVVLTKDDFTVIERNEFCSEVIESSLEYNGEQSMFYSCLGMCLGNMVRRTGFIDLIKAKAFDLHGKHSPKKIICDSEKLEIRVVF